MRWKTVSLVFANIFIALLIGALALLFDLDSGIYQSGRKILVREGPVASGHFFDQKVEETGDLRALFGSAWSSFARGETEKAFEDAHFIVSETRDDWLRASSLYLLGQINTLEGNHSVATIQLFEAHTIYVRIGKKGNAFQTLLALASNSLRDNRVSLARDFLDRADEIIDHAGKSLGDYWSLRSVIALYHRDFAEGLRVSGNALDAYATIENHQGMLRARSDIAFFEIANGDIKGGLEETEQIAREIGPGNRSMYAYNLVNELFADVRLGHPYGATYEEISRLAHELEDPFLLEILDFVVTWPDHDDSRL